MSIAAELTKELRDLRRADGSFCEARLLKWRWLIHDYVGQCECLRCGKTAQVDLSDRPRLVKCIDGCGSSWTLAGLCKDFGWPSPPSAIPSTP